jgi:3-deoxy-7-phosphoheptulonate synthase
MDVLPTYRELKEQLPITSFQSDFIEKSREIVNNILNGTDPRLLLIVGPCSVHCQTAAKEYASLLKELASEISSQFFMIMRVYCEKPRTKKGWKGFLYDPYLDDSNDLKTGIEWTRKLMLNLTDIGMPIATEFLDPLTAFYYEDLITWGSIGARTSSSQTHRQLASGLNMPIGIKNGIAGNIAAAIDGVIAASHSHTYVGINEEGSKTIVRTNGNPSAHVVLRGGESGPNYDNLSVLQTLSKLEKSHLMPIVLIDCSHHNSNKQFYNQPAVFTNVLEQITAGNTNIRGCMIESNLFSGSQTLTFDPNQLEYGISITDSCLDWKTTRQLVLWGAQQLMQQSSLNNHAIQAKFSNLSVETFV